MTVLATKTWEALGIKAGASKYMMSKNDLNSDELDTLRRSRNPTVVLTANGKVHTREESQVFVHDLNLFVTENFAKTTDTSMSGSAVKNHG